MEGVTLAYIVALVESSIMIFMSVFYVSFSMGESTCNS